MDDRSPRSVSMSIPSPSQTSSQQWQHALQASQRALHQHSMASPHLQQFRNGVWAPDHHSPMTSSFEEKRGVQSPDSDTTVKLPNSVQGSNVPEFKTKPDCFAAGLSMMKRTAVGLGVEKAFVDEYLADDAVLRAVRPQQEPLMFGLPSSWNQQVHSRVSSGGMTDYIHVDDNYQGPNHAFRQLGSPKDFQVPEQMNLRHRRMGSPQDLHVPEQSNLHHRRMSSRMPSLPNIPSPLGPGRMGKRISSNTLVSPARGQKFEYEALMSSVPASPTVQGYLTGLHQRKADVNGVASSSPHQHGFGNGLRQDTDPFIDTTETPVSAQFTLPYQRIPTTPGFPTASVPHTPFTPSFAASQGGRPLLPIPPPPLSSIHGQYSHTPATRAKLYAQEAVREDWIRNTAADIARLSQLRYHAEQQYLFTQSSSDYEAWQEAEAAYAAATDLEARKEERRNLFLAEKGMKALKTGVIGDASATAGGQKREGGKEGEEGEEKLLGFKMAFMERVCAGVKREEQSEDGITREMLGTLTVEERKALRAHLVGRLARV